MDQGNLSSTVHLSGDQRSNAQAQPPPHGLSMAWRERSTRTTTLTTTRFGEVGPAAPGARLGRMEEWFSPARICRLVRGCSSRFTFQTAYSSLRRTTSTHRPGPHRMVAMTHIDESAVIQLVAEALALDPSEVTLETSSASHAEWDSLGHLDILQRLDTKFPGVAAKNPDIATAQSVREIVEALNGDQ